MYRLKKKEAKKMLYIQQQQKFIYIKITQTPTKLHDKINVINYLITSVYDIQLDEIPLLHTI